MTYPRRYTVTAALPYSNGPLHVGHLAGVYVPADIYARYLRSRKRDVAFICGSDEHGVPITIKAKSEGVSPQQIVDRYHTINKKAFADLGISFDIYSRTSNEMHHKTASEFFLKLYNDGKFMEMEEEHYFDEQQQQFLADRYITGTCPNCNFEKAYGDQCESCGTSLSPTELINPISGLSGNKPMLKKTKHWYLPLQDYEQWIKEWIVDGHKKDWKTNVYGQVKSWLDAGLKPRAVTRDLDWGVAVPKEIPGSEGKVLYVWFDAPIGYISATKEWAQEKGIDWEPYWKDAQTKLVHFIGKDNIVFHCIIFPAMLKADGSYILPDNVPANEFLNLENDKISTSRNWAVWLHEYLQDFPGKEDALRYVLTANAPESKDNDFTWKDFQARNNNELLAILGNFVNRTLILTQKYYSGDIPQVTEYTPEDVKLIEQLALFPEKIAEKIELYRFRDGLTELMNLARMGNKYLTDNEPWKLQKTDPERVKTIINISIQICANIAILAEPFIPFTAAKINRMLNMSTRYWEDAGKIELLPGGHRLGDPELLFERIEDAAIEQQRDKLLQTKEVNKLANKTVTPSKEAVDFEAFAKMDIRVGTITAAEKVAKTKKLLKLTVDTGIDVREVVSGIAEHFDPQEIIGQQVSILVNLQPKTLKGFESKGMVLMAEDENGKLYFVSPQQKVANGAEIK